jgi:hypothetical protein
MKGTTDSIEYDYKAFANSTRLNKVIIYPLILLLQVKKNCSIIVLFSFSQRSTE